MMWYVWRRGCGCGFHRLGLGDLYHYRRVYHLSWRAVSDLRRVAGMGGIRRDRVSVVGTCSVDRAWAWNMMFSRIAWVAGSGNGDISGPVAGCTGWLGVGGRGPWADDFIRGLRIRQGRGGVGHRQIT